jgi:hypothetical protein
LANFLFISPTDAQYIYYIKIKIYIIIFNKTADTYFGLTTILREHIILIIMTLTKVNDMLPEDFCEAKT